jgi:hypothetical protein
MRPIMVTEAKDRQVNTDAPARSDDGKRLPHERDESPEGHPPKERSVIRQAASDLEQGLVDTDLHGTRGVEKVQPRAPGTAQPGSKRD